MRSLLLGSIGLGSYYLSQKESKCCGIIGVLSSKSDNVASKLSIGVELLKNRGYDSAGIATFSIQNGQATHSLIKRAEQANEKMNCINRLTQDVANTIVKSTIGIGHTRWATCGQKIQKNAHPHYDQDKNIFLVHNGIIGGYPVIKNKYLQNCQFNSQTDSEVIVQLLSKFRSEGLEMIDAIRQTEKIMIQTSNDPQWGIVVIDKRQPDRIWTSTFGSPILIGFNNQEIYIASEPIAFKKEVEEFFVTKSGEIWQLSVDKIPKMRQEMTAAKRLTRVQEKDKLEIMVAPPEPYKSFYSYEIRQQGMLKFQPQFDRVKGSVKFGDYLTFIACGSSYYAALSSEYFFKSLKCFNKINFYDPVELLEGDIVDNETVIFISQSGETKDLINVIKCCRDIEGVRTVGIINVEGSTIAREVDFPIYIKVGREVSVAATKSMLHQCLNLTQLAVQVARKKNSAPVELLNQIQNNLKDLPKSILQTIEMVEKDCEVLAEQLYLKESIYLLAKRQTMAIAREASLKIKQLNYIHAQALGASEMKHGPIALIDSEKKGQSTVIIFVLDNDTFGKLVNTVDQMVARNARVIIVTDCRDRIDEHYKVDKKQLKKDEQLSNQKQKLVLKSQQIFYISVPKVKHLSHILCLLPMQILVQKICILKKINPDMPRNLAKTVTV